MQISNIFHKIKLSLTDNKNKKLKQKTYHDLDEYKLSGTFDCKVVRVYDGDTVYLCIHKDGQYFRICGRLLGVNTPEMPVSHAEAMDCESAYNARDMVIKLTTNVSIPNLNVYTDTSDVRLPSLSDTDMQKIVDKNTLILRQGVTLYNFDKYGRYLIRLKTKENKDISDDLIAHNLGVPTKNG